MLTYTCYAYILGAGYMAERSCSDEHGSFLSERGVSPAMLLSHNSAELPSIEVSNGVMLDLYHFLCKHPQCTFQSFRRWVAILMGYKWPIVEFPTAKALRQSVIRLSNRLTKFRKEPNSVVKDALIKSFFCRKICLPKYVVHGKLCSSSTSSSSCDYCEDIQSENESLKSHNAHLISEISMRNEEVKENRRKVKESQYKLYSLHRNSRKKIMRRDQEIKSKKQEVTEKSKLIVDLEKKLVEVDIKFKA